MNSISCEFSVNEAGKISQIFIHNRERTERNCRTPKWIDTPIPLNNIYTDSTNRTVCVTMLPTQEVWVYTVDLHGHFGTHTNQCLWPNIFPVLRRLVNLAIVFGWSSVSPSRPTLHAHTLISVYRDSHVMYYFMSYCLVFLPRLRLFEMCPLCSFLRSGHVFVLLERCTYVCGR